MLVWFILLFLLHGGYKENFVDVSTMLNDNKDNLESCV